MAEEPSSFLAETETERVFVVIVAVVIVRGGGGEEEEEAGKNIP